VFARVTNAVDDDVGVDADVADELCPSLEDLLPQPDTRATRASARQPATELETGLVTLRWFGCRLLFPKNRSSPETTLQDAITWRREPSPARLCASTERDQACETDSAGGLASVWKTTQ
jgi:hypothetical protein